MFGFGKKDKAPTSQPEETPRHDLPSEEEVDKNLEQYAEQKNAEIQKQQESAEAEKAAAAQELGEHIEKQDAMAGVGAAAVSGAQEAPQTPKEQ